MAKTKDRKTGEVAQVTVAGWTIAQLAEIVAEKLLHEKGLSETVDRKVDEAIDKAVGTRLEKITDEILRKVVAEIVDEGFQPTDNYGSPIGQKVSLKVRVGQILHEKDRYNNESRVEKIQKETIEAALRKALGEEIERVRKAFREQVDALLQTKLVESLRTSLGLAK